MAIAFRPPPRANILPPRSDRKSTRLNSSHLVISYAVFCLKKKKKKNKHILLHKIELELEIISPFLKYQINFATHQDMQSCCTTHTLYATYILTHFNSPIY